MVFNFKFLGHNSLKEGNLKQSNSCFTNILVFILSDIILLLGMWIFSFFSEGIINSVVNIIPLCLAIIFAIKKTKIEFALKSKITLITIIFLSVIVLLNIWLCSEVQFRDYLLGKSANLSDHPEHSLMFKEMEIIATRLKEGLSLSQATKGLRLNQYYNIFVYSSMMFLMGGVNPTNMCIWSAFHTAMCPVFLVLMSERYGISDSKHLKLIYVVTLIQPLFLSFSTYNKVIIGELLLMIAMYIYICTYNNPIRNLLCLPIYGYLMWTVRLQYLLIAAFLFVVCLIHNKLSKKIIIPFIAAILIGGIFLFRSGLVQLYEDLNINYYTEGHDLSLASIPARIIRSVLPYFPLSNIFTDRYWSFNIFCIFQEIMNITLWGLVLFNNWKINVPHIKLTFANPMILAAIALLLGGTFSELHTTYLSVGTMLLTTACDDVKVDKVFGVYLGVLITVVFLTIVYVLLGLTGSGIASVSF